MVVLHHKHSLFLIDLNPKYPHDEQVYDDEEDLIIKQAFKCLCARCEQEITYLHRYYYKCDQCDYSLHKLCERIPTKLQHVSHSAHSLTLFLDESLGQCHICKSTPRYKQLKYHCSRCMFNICLDCATGDIQHHTIYHPSHQHPLIPGCRQRQIFAECDACGKKHRGVFYECITCFHFLIHKDCVFQPKRLLIQDGTYGRFFHTHPLVLTYSFPIVHQKATFYPTCRVCDNSFFENENLWVYKCDKCRYYAHTDCANAIHKASSSNSESNENSGDVLTFEEYKEMKDKCHALDFPLPDLSNNRFTTAFSKESNEMSITHNSHEHPLIFVDSRCNDVTKVEDLCNGCDSPITTMPFYKCANGCNFVLHEWCTRLPTELKGHHHSSDLAYELHTIVLLPQVSHDFFCNICSDNCNGFSYLCIKCDYSIDVWCALIPRIITHKSHPYHLFFKVRERLDKDYCRLCLSGFTNPEETSFSCLLCNFHLHPECALLLRETTRQRYDKHPMTLSYRPVEDHIGDVITFEGYKKIKVVFHVLDLPLPDLSKNRFTTLFSKESNEMSITHNSHEHPLIFEDSRCNDVTKVEDLCNGCDSPITTMPFYKCANGCNFVLHEWCTRLPSEIKGHHSSDLREYELHTIVLLPKVSHDFRCDICSDNCNGFAYHCTKCDYSIDVWCALIPRIITHKSHPYHLFFKVRERLDKDYCRLCLSGFTNPEETSFSCLLCNFHLHPECALLLPETTRQRYDKHPMTLSYRPVEDHIADYFCEVCEEEINPNGAFYHCHECLQSMHTTCAPLVPLRKPHIHDLHVKGVHENDDKYEEFTEVMKQVNRMVTNLFQTTSRSTVPQGPSTSS